MTIPTARAPKFNPTITARRASSAIRPRTRSQSGYSHVEYLIMLTCVSVVILLGALEFRPGARHSAAPNREDTPHTANPESLALLDH